MDKNSSAHYKNICSISDLRLECGEPRTWALVCTGAVGGAAAAAWCTAARPPRPTPPAPAPCSCWAAGSGPDTRTGRSQPEDTRGHVQKMFRIFHCVHYFANEVLSQELAVFCAVCDATVGEPLVDGNPCPHTVCITKDNDGATSSE